MSSVWDRFDSIASTEEVSEAKARFESPEAGNYEAVLEKLEPAESKDGLPMLKGSFRAVEGGKLLFYNQMLQNLNYPALTASNIADAVTFVGALLQEDIAYEGMAKFAEQVASVKTGGVYTINISYGKKDLENKFPKFKVIDCKEAVPF
jgi:hypothetical protein